MSVGSTWLSTVREKNRVQLGLGGLGGVTEQLAADYARRSGSGSTATTGSGPVAPVGPPAPASSLSMPAFVPSKIPTYLGLGAAGLVVLGLGYFAYNKFKG